MFLEVRNWAKFQHYKDRCPPWIKLSTDTFQNPDFSCLHGASKLLALAIWTLASKNRDGLVPDDLNYITQWGFLAGQVEQQNLEELVNKGFLTRVAIKKLAQRKQGARERRGETEERQRRGEETLARFPDWLPLDSWNAFVEMRKKLRAPLTLHGKNLIIAELDKLRTHYDPAAVLDQSTMNSWKGVFALHEKGNGSYSKNRDAEVGLWDGTISDSMDCFRCGVNFKSANAVEGIFCSSECAAAKPQKAS